IVVDNASSDDTVAVIRNEFPGLKKNVICQPINLFYTRAMNICMQSARGEYLLVINPDCYFEISMVDQLVESLELDGSIGICGPAFRFPDGNSQASGNMFPLRGAFLEFALGKSERFFKLTEGLRSAQSPNVRYFDFIYGAGFMIKREFY